MLFELIKPQITTSEINHSALDIRSAEGREMFLGSTLSTYRYKCTMYDLFVWISHFFGDSTSFDICKCFRLNCNFAPTIIKNSWWFFFSISDFHALASSYKHSNSTFMSVSVYLGTIFSSSLFKKCEIHNHVNRENWP